MKPFISLNQRPASFFAFTPILFGALPWLLFYGSWLGVLPARGAEVPVRPLVRAHSHNDYEQKRPLLDALEQGFCSIEADVWLVAGELRVAHDLAATRPGRTLEKLYLDPLLGRVNQNGGRVFPGGPSVLLLVDVKSDATNTYRQLRQVLRGYESMLTRFESNRIATNAVSVVISGNRALGLMAADPVRWAGYDGRLTDLEAANGADPHLIPLISDNWVQHFQWRGRAEEGGVPPEDGRKLRQLVQRAHARGHVLRLWGTPDSRAAWQELNEAGVDLINTDDLAGLGNFLRERH